MRYIITLHPDNCPSIRQEVVLARPLLCVTGKTPEELAALVKQNDNTTIINLPPGVNFSVQAVAEPEVNKSVWISDLEAQLLQSMYRCKSLDSMPTTIIRTKLSRKGLITFDSEGWRITKAGIDLLKRRGLV